MRELTDGARVIARVQSAPFWMALMNVYRSGTRVNLFFKPPGDPGAARTRFDSPGVTCSRSTGYASIATRFACRGTAVSGEFRIKITKTRQRRTNLVTLFPCRNRIECRRNRGKFVFHPRSNRWPAHLLRLPGRRKHGIQAEEAEKQHANQDDCDQGVIKTVAGIGIEHERPQRKHDPCMNLSSWLNGFIGNRPLSFQRRENPK